VGYDWFDATFLLLVVGGFAAMTVVSVFRAFRMVPVMQALRALGVAWEKLGYGEFTSEAGTRVEVHAQRNGEQITHVELHWPTRIGTSLQLSAADRAGPFAKAALVTGDEAFDRAVHLSTGDDLLALSVLGPSAREAIREAVTAGARFHDHRWKLDGMWSAVAPLRKAIAAIDRAHAAMQPAATAEEVTQRVTSLATGDPELPVRLLAIEVLARRRLASDELLDELQRDLQPAIRLEAARAHGEAGRPTLRQLLAQGSATYRHGAAQALAALGPADDLAAVEDALLAALTDERFTAEAGDALARIGTARLMPALGAITDEPARSAADTARAAIRARIDPELAGSLSLTAEGGGQLSVAEARANDGALTVTDR